MALALLALAPLPGFSPVISSRGAGANLALRPLRSTQLTMLDNPYDAIASPLRKFEAPPAVADGGNPLTDLPIEVGLLFGAILVVGVLGLLKQSGALTESAPTVGLGESREDLAPDAAAAAGQDQAEMTQGQKEKQYFAILAEEQAQKRGGSNATRKKKKKSRK